MQNIIKAREIIKEADGLLFTAGAGMGVDSGLPDFRGNEGFWKAYPPIAKLGISFSGMANPRWFKKDVHLAWAFYGHRLNLYRNTTPHKGFDILLKLGESKPLKYFVFTSNVDGAFQKAGFEEERIEECHGSIHYLQCKNSCKDEIWSADNIEIEVDMEKFIAKNFPRCPYCGAVARPNILMFGDWNWIEKREIAQSRRLIEWLNIFQKQNLKLAIIEVGAGEVVPTVRFMGERVAREYNASLIRINPQDYEVDERYGISIPLGGLEGIKEVCDF